MIKNKIQTLLLLLIAIIFTSCSDKDIDKKVPVTGITIKQTEQTLAVRESRALEVKVLPENATNKEVTWTSSDISVATVTGNGIVTANKKGRAIITATTIDGGKTANCNVNVEEVSVTGVTLNLEDGRLRIKVGETLTLKATVLPENATNQLVSWVSDNPFIVSVTGDGLYGIVYGVKRGGSVRITVTTAEGNKKDYCWVLVE